MYCHDSIRHLIHFGVLYFAVYITYTYSYKYCGIGNTIYFIFELFLLNDLIIY